MRSFRVTNIQPNHKMATDDTQRVLLIIDMNPLVTLVTVSFLYVKRYQPS